MNCTPCAAILGLAAALGVSGCQATDGPVTAQIAPPVPGQLAAMIEGSGATDQDYDLVPAADGRVFLVLDCAGSTDAQSLTARRADGRGWGLPSPGPQLDVRCDEDGQRLAILVHGTAAVPVPIKVATAGDQWRIAQTYQRPNG